MEPFWVYEHGFQTIGNMIHMASLWYLFLPRLDGAILGVWAWYPNHWKFDSYGITLVLFCLKSGRRGPCWVFGHGFQMIHDPKYYTTSDWLGPGSNKQ